MWQSGRRPHLFSFFYLLDNGFAVAEKARDLDEVIGIAVPKDEWVGAAAFIGSAPVKRLLC